MNTAPYITTLFLIWHSSSSSSVVKGDTGCSRQPADLFIPLAAGCQANVGTCQGTPCQVPFCAKDESRCCVARETEKLRVTCGDDVLVTEKITLCGCDPCNPPRAFITGSAICSDSPACKMSIKRGGATISQTDQDGSFGFFVDFPGDETLILTFVDEEQNEYFPQIKLVNVIEDQHFYRFEVAMTIKPPPTEFEASTGAVVPLGDNDEIYVKFTPGSVTLPNGDPYDGEVELSINFIDPLTSDAADAPAELLLSSEPPEYLRSYGMLGFDLRTPGGDELSADGVEFYLDQTRFLNNEDLGGVGVYVFDTSSGTWQLMTDMTTISGVPTVGSGRRKRTTRTFYVGELNITVGFIYNLDVVVGRYCLLKVRFFEGADLTEALQMPSATIFGIYSRDGAWGNYLTRTSSGTGVCLSFPCNGNIVADAIITAEYYGQPLFVSPMPSVDAGLLSTLSFATSVDMHSFYLTVPPSSDGIIYDDANGPIYYSGSQCYSAPFSEYFFSFYRELPLDMEMNTVPVDESNIFAAWDPSILSWWQNRDNFTACYLKVQLSFLGCLNCTDRPDRPARRAKRQILDGFPNFPVKVEVTSKGGTHPVTAGSVYGTRSSWNIADFACIEYRCSGVLLDGDFDRTMIKVEPLYDNFVLVEVNNNLEAEQGNSSLLGAASVSLLAPAFVSGDIYGIYSATDGHPTSAKTTARNRCIAGNVTAIEFGYVTNSTLIFNGQDIPN